MGRTAKDIKDNRYGSLIATDYLGSSMWLCKCDCGNDRIVRIGDLESGKVVDCGRCSTTIAAHEDLRERTFVHLTVVDYIGNSKWLCKCDCGNISIVRGSDLKSGRVVSCGHVSKTGKLVDLSGKQFNKWTVLEYAGDRQWLCRCKCGREKKVWAKFLKSGQSKSCGHSIIEERLGDKFGHLRVIGRENLYRWICKCDCGNIVVVSGQNLLSGKTQSCGCKSASNPKYTKHDIESILEILKVELGRNPYFSEFSSRLNVVDSAAYNYLNKYNLKDKIAHSEGSRYEREIVDILSSKFKDVIVHDRDLLHGMELDIYIPEIKTAIEFNGTYWHCTLQKYKNYHQDKTIVCAKQGIRLIHIFEYEWKDIIIKNKLINMLVKDTRNVGARNTYIKEIDVNTEREFLDKYHLSGYTASYIKLGCFDKKTHELLGVMTFGKPRFNNNYEYEIIRLCWKDDICVIGGIEKLFKYFLNNFNPKSILTYSDISKFTGNCYSKIGFRTSADSITEPNYKWVSLDSNTVLTRYQTQKHKLIDKGLGNINQTEDEIMENLNFVKVYDSGNLKLEWTSE